MKTTISSNDSQRRSVLLDKPLGAKYGSHTSVPITLTFAQDISHKQAKQLLEYHINNYLGRYKYAFYLEFGETNGRVHFHGIIHGITAARLRAHKFCTRWKQIYGFYHISRLTNLLAWHIYCRKDQSIFKHPDKARITSVSIKHKFNKKVTLNKIFEDFI